MIKVFLTGTFDIIHRGHIEFLKYAKSQGDYLAVAVDTDARVKEKKGNTRPYNSLEDRLYVLNSIKYIDKLFSFSSDEELIKIIQMISPELMLAGSDWQGKTIVGDKYAKSVDFFDRVGSYSTTRILNEG
jgi:D-beta-D-heptose 7-phosphate kinase/D-beta-D-heptose 1-phosphate adenosyltransferase